MAQSVTRTESEVGGTIFLFGDPEQEVAQRKKWWELLKVKCCSLPAYFRQEDPENKRKALVTKSGSYRIYTAGLSEHKRKFLADIYITLIDLEWRYALALLFNAFLATFMLFAIFWWLMARNNGDFDNLNNPNHEFCILGVSSFPDAILFSIETQTTIGYGMAYPNAECAGTLPILYLQVVMGFFLESLLMGLVFMKVARPKHRAQTILFSRHAVVNLENGNLVLQVRVGDLRKSHLVNASIAGMVIRRRSTDEGAYYPLYQFNCQFTANGMEDRVFLLWPIVLTHVIDKDSPLYDIRPGNLSLEKFEIVLYLSGTVESTGETCQARTSYLPNEILWGHHFERIEEYDIGHRRWHIDFAGFNDVVYRQNLRHSAKELNCLRERSGDDVSIHSNGVSIEGAAETLGAFPRYDLTSTYDNMAFSTEKKKGQIDSKF